MGFTLIKRPKKNVGDFLIWERAKALLEKHTDEKEFLVYEGWKQLGNQLSEINKTKAVIICGGPGYQKDFYPRVYPFLEDVRKIKCPVIPFGLGWGGEPMYRPTQFSFNKISQKIISYIHKKCEATSCRDIITEKILNKYEFKNVLMTGDPAWYDLGSIGKRFEQKKRINHVVVTPPANVIFYEQALNLMRKLRDLFQSAQFFLAFHRGIKSDKYTSEGEARFLQKLEREAIKLNYQTVNVAYNTSKIEFYRKCDLHVGYRVHGHIYFLSVRKPSFLLQEDGRGYGLTKSLELADVPARGPKISERFYQIAGLPTRFSNALDRAFSNNLVHPSVLGDAVGTIIKNIRKEYANRFPTFRNLHKKIDDHYYPVMIRFLKTLP